MNSTKLADSGMPADVVKKDRGRLWRVAPLALCIGAIIAIGLLVEPTISSTTTVWVHFLGRRFVVARGGIPSVIAPIVLLLFAVFIPGWALINAVRTPQSSFTALGRRRSRWVAALALLFLIPDASFLVVPIYYLLRVRPQLNLQRADASV